jgi:hypothetical protein
MNDDYGQVVGIANMMLLKILWGYWRYNSIANDDAIDREKEAADVLTAV